MESYVLEASVGVLFVLDWTTSVKCPFCRGSGNWLTQNKEALARRHRENVLWQRLMPPVRRTLSM